MGYLSCQGGVVPSGGEGIRHEMLIDSIPLDDVLNVWDYLENRGIRVEKFNHYEGNRCAISVSHSDKTYLEDKIFEALIGEENA